MKNTLYSKRLDRLIIFIIEEMENDTIIKEIPNTDGRYFISNTGYVLSLCHNKPRILKPYRSGKGYASVKIDGKNKKIH